MPLFATCAASAGQRVCRVHTSTPLSCSAAGSYGREGTGLFSARRTCPLHTSYRCANWKPERGAADCHETMRSSATNGAQFFLWQCKTIRKPVYLQTIRPFMGHCYEWMNQVGDSLPLRWPLKKNILYIVLISCMIYLIHRARYHMRYIIYIRVLRKCNFNFKW